MVHIFTLEAVRNLELIRKNRKEPVKGLLTGDELCGPDREWQSVDGCMVKAPLARDAAGRNSTGRGKRREETQC
jgi:hypothetical protein